MTTSIHTTISGYPPDRHNSRHDPALRPRLVIHYFIAIAIITVYGIQVCPFIETLKVHELASSLLAVMTLLYVLRRPLHEKFVIAAPYRIQSRRSFTVDILLFITAALLLTWFNTLVYGFPVESGMKLLLGLAALGFFIAIDMTLAWERHLIHYFSHNSEQLHIDTDYFPLTRKMALVATASAFFMMGVIFLIVNKDLEWLVHVGNEISLYDARQAILGEVGFVALVFLLYVLAIIRAFSLNLGSNFHNQNYTMSLATRGIFDTCVPVSSNDEFGEMAHHTNRMIQGLQKITDELNLTRDVTILSLATLAETRDNETGAHIIRTQHYVRVLAEHLSGQDKYRDYLLPGRIELIYKSAPLHDIGKVGIPDHILLKPGKLTFEEFEIMKAHTTLGGEALRVAEQYLGESSFLAVAEQIATTHHEKWDGSGYPDGLRGEAIPLAGRLMALADVYDALISKRVYKDAMPHTQAREMILQGRGRHFDPDVVDAFIAVEQEFIDIAHRHNDADYLSQYA